MTAAERDRMMLEQNADITSAVRLAQEANDKADRALEGLAELRGADRVRRDYENAPGAWTAFNLLLSHQQTRWAIAILILAVAGVVGGPYFMSWIASNPPGVLHAATSSDDASPSPR